MTSTLLESDLRTKPAHGEGVCSHIVAIPKGTKTTAAALVMEARIEGFEVVALCGHVWIPSRNPKDHPICPKCLDLYKAGDDGTNPDRANIPPEA